MIANDIHRMSCLVILATVLEYSILAVRMVSYY